MKKLLSFLLILTLSVTMSACSGPKPENTVKSFLDSYKNGNITEAIKYVEGNENFNIEKIKKDFEVNQNDKTTQAFLKAFSKLEYKIINSKVENNTAVVETEITVPNLGKVIAELMKEAFTLALSSAFSDNNNQSDMDSMMETMLLDKINSEDIPMVKKVVNINLVKQDNSWVIKADEEFANAITGNLLEISKVFSK
ncbi:hypothetical protein Y919_02745 [Caloranaerobacter azorensis H53214]|uniref:Uncharacterized protein n=1 Tax=Caloranaerobacter azorensis H53214 TaxID=1156417 RepID=A0A096BIU7_9FIRM|nr:DUF4878 domain-containing protein [Caloranaerobacter azorensis]KGG81090.1 hypothetical protein Y919_02745 [Caloranaerobacter azorensis H53214]